MKPLEYAFKIIEEGYKSKDIVEDYYICVLVCDLSCFDRIRNQFPPTNTERKSMRAWPNSDCPTCGAKPYAMCTTKKGRRSERPHASRPMGNLKGKIKPMKDQMVTIEV